MHGPLPRRADLLTNTAPAPLHILHHDYETRGVLNLRKVALTGTPPTLIQKSHVVLMPSMTVQSRFGFLLLRCRRYSLKLQATLIGGLPHMAALKR
jgi:hypothetical protein